MRSTFAGLEIARTGLTMSQKGLDLTGHNIANVDTAGYTRQRIVTTAYAPSGANGQFAPVDSARVGAGVNVKILDQIRSAFYDKQYRTEQSLYSNWSTRTTGLTYVESLFEDTEDSALNEGINNLFQGFMTLTTEANDKEQRTVIQQAAISLTDSFNQIYDRLIELQDSQDTAVSTVVGQVNTIADNIAMLNKSIYAYEINGQPANDLRDQRNLLLDELSGLVEVDYHETNDGKLIVEVAGEELVNHVTANSFTLSKDLTTPLVSNDYVVTIGSTTLNGVTSDDLGGELKAHLDLRDNETSDTPGIPYYINQLNTLARAIVQNVNAIHRKGFTHPASGSPSDDDVNFFEEPADIKTLTAGNLKLDDRILASVYNIAASNSEIDLTGTGVDLQQGNQENARAIYELINLSNLGLDLDADTVSDVSIGGLNSFMSGIILDVAITLKHSKTNFTNQKIDLQAVDNQRTSISGVSLDEEMTNLIKYQHAYNGAARVITTMDEALDVLINRMGTVGR